MFIYLTAVSATTLLAAASVTPVTTPLAVQRIRIFRSCYGASNSGK